MTKEKLKYDDKDIELKKFEYSMAHSMFRHYEVLEWQIGSILISGTLIFTGLALSKDSIDYISGNSITGWCTIIGIPLLSLIILFVWRLWLNTTAFKENLSSEVMDRIKLQLGMYNSLRLVEPYLKEYIKKEKKMDKYTY
jgi:hypothetical protein